MIYQVVIENLSMATRSDAAIRDANNRRARLRQWIDERFQGSQAEFVSAHKLNQGEISALLKDKSFGGVKARNLEAQTGMPEHYLEQRSSEEGESALQRTAAPFDSNAKLVAPGVRQYPVISHIQAGCLTEISNPYGPGDGFDVEFGEDDASQWAFFLEIKGDSMLPDFRQGDRVLIDPEVCPGPGDFVAARNTKREATFKKYRVRGISDAGHEIFELVPLNDDYPVLRSDEHHLTVIGTMIEHRRKFRRK